MRIVAVNGGPRRGKNTDQMLDALIQGVKEAAPDAEVQMIRLYDYTFTGCKSCFACQLKKNRDYPQCWLKDDITELLRDTRNADGIVFASPIYYCNVTAQLRAFWERLLYPGADGRTIPTVLIYTGNATEEQFKEFMGAPLDINSMYLNGCFKLQPEVVIAGNTFQYNDKDIYNDGFRAPAKAKWEHHEKQFKIDLQKAYEAGMNMVTIVKEKIR